MTIGHKAPTDPIDEFTRKLADYERRIADLERAARRGSTPTSMTTTQRDALTGVDRYRGRTIFNTTTGGIDVYYGATTGWRPEWSQPWGLLQSVATGDYTLTVNTGTLITSAIVFTTVIGRRYRLVYLARALGSVAGTIRLVALSFGGADALTPAHEYASTERSYGIIHCQWVFAGDGNGKSYQIAAYDNAINMGVWGTLFYLEDIGPSANAPAS